jgi:hypothetical protein
MDGKQLNRVLNHLAEQHVPADINLWSGIQAKINKSPITHQEKPLNTRLPRFKPVLIPITVMCILILYLLFTPQGRVLAQQIISFFTRKESDTLPVQSWQLTPVPTPADTVTPDPANIQDASSNVAEVEKQAGYDVLEPTWLPDILTFKGASIEEEHNIVRIFYQYEDTNGLVLREELFQITEDCELCGTVGASAEIKTVTIGDTTGEYVEGTWNLTDSGPVWVSDPYLKTLRWQVDGMAYELLYMGPPESLSQADMVAIAASLK